MTNLISVVIPFYEGKEWLIEAIESVLDQSYKNFEILVINDGSHEDISDIEYFKLTNVCLFNKKNEGAASARNVGIEKSRGKYIAFLDSDDLWDKDKLAKQVEYMEVNKLIWSQHSYYKFWRESKKNEIVDTSIYIGNVFLDVFISFKVQTSTVMVVRNVLINENIRFPLEFRRGQDGEFYKELAKKYELGHVAGLYGGFRMRGGNVGFNPKVLLHNKFQVWNKIKGDKESIRKLPRIVKLSFRYSAIICKLANTFNRCLGLKPRLEFLLFGCAYITPYFLFKINAYLYGK